MRQLIARPGVQWAIRLLVMAGLVVNGRVADWSWPVSIVTAMLLVFFSMKLGHRIGLYLDVRRGLARREWRAVAGMANHARVSSVLKVAAVKGEHRSRFVEGFDRTSLKWMKGTDESVVVGYATVLLNALIARELGPRPTSNQLDDLVARVATPWMYLMNGDMATLDSLVRQACNYRTNGFPAASWDNCRGLAATVGILTPPIAVRRSLRRSVSTEYSRAKAVQMIPPRGDDCSPGALAKLGLFRRVKTTRVRLGRKPRPQDGLSSAAWDRLTSVVVVVSAGDGRAFASYMNRVAGRGKPVDQSHVGVYACIALQTIIGRECSEWPSTPEQIEAVVDRIYPLWHKVVINYDRNLLRALITSVTGNARDGEEVLGVTLLIGCYVALASLLDDPKAELAELRPFVAERFQEEFPDQLERPGQPRRVRLLRSARDTR